MKYLQKATHTVAFFIVGLFFGVSAQENPQFQFRGIWVVRTSMTSKVSIDSVLDFAQTYQFNHLFLQVRGRGDAFYKSDLAPRSNTIKDEFDPLLYAISEGHKRNLKIHAWINVFLLWSSNSFPQDSTHIMNSHPEWVDGSLMDNHKVESEFQNNSGNGIKKFLNPAIPEVIDHLISVCEELLARYDIDGLHLDYIRYQDMDYGYNSLAIQKFKDASGVSPIDSYIFGNSPVEIGVNKKQNQIEIWDDFRRASVTEFVRKCNSLILKVNSNVVLSAAVKPNLWEANNRYFQAWDQWIINGYVDFVIPMNYFPDLENFSRNVDLMMDIIPSKYHQGIILGLAVYNQDTNAVKQKIRYSRGAGFSGISIFSYDARKDDTDYFETIVPELLK